MVIQDGTIVGVCQDTLSTRTKHGTVAAEDKRAAIAIHTAHTVAVNVRAANALGPADIDLVLLARRRVVGVVPAADTRAEEEVVVALTVVHERTLESMFAGGIKGNVEWSARRGSGVGGHGHLEDVGPKGAKGQGVGTRGSILDEVAVNGVVGGTSGRGDASAAVVSPGAGLHGGGGGVSDGGILDTKARDGVVQDVSVANEMDVGGLRILSACPGIQCPCSLREGFV